MHVIHMKSCLLPLSSCNANINMLTVALYCSTHSPFCSNSASNRSSRAFSCSGPKMAGIAPRANSTAARRSMPK